jgi:hypothetical protein
MENPIKRLNDFLKLYSGIIVSLLIILGAILAFSGKFKDWAFDDIYDHLYKIENNDLKHNTLYHEYADKKFNLILDIMAGIVPQNEIANQRASIEAWYARELSSLLKSQTDRKGNSG